MTQAELRSRQYATTIMYCLGMQSSKEIASFTITEPHKTPEGATSLSCKVSFELDLHGLVHCIHALHCHKVEVEDPASTDAATAAAPADTAVAEAVDNATAAMDTDAPPETKPVLKKTKKVHLHTHCDLALALIAQGP